MPEALRLGFAQFQEELLLISRLADEFLSSDTRFRLHQAATSLEQIWSADSRNDGYHLGIAIDAPLRTIPSTTYGGGATPVWAELSFIWTLNPIGPIQKKVLQRRQFEVVGKASTRVRFAWSRAENAIEEVAMWRMEIATPDGPGAFFHAQVRGADDSLPFPAAVPVPRLPCMVPTPPLVLEFVLAELFQDQWIRGLEKRTTEAATWRRLQSPRYERMLNWQLGALGGVTPLVGLKQAKPSADLLV